MYLLAYRCIVVLHLLVGLGERGELALPFRRHALRFRRRFGLGVGVGLALSLGAGEVLVLVLVLVLALAAGEAFALGFGGALAFLADVDLLACASFLF